VKDENPEPYQPINCSFHDRLEHHSVRQDVVEVVFEWKGRTLTHQAQIKDVFAWQGADYAFVIPIEDVERTGFTVRLDRMVSIEGIKLPRNC